MRDDRAMAINFSARQLATLAISLGALIASPATTAVASGTSPVYTHHDTGRTVHLSVGATFEVKLATCADCGDSWHWVHRPSKHIVKELSKRIVTKVKPPEVGGMATTIYRFKVVGGGTTHEGLVETGPSGKSISHFRLTEVNHRTG